MTISTESYKGVRDFYPEDKSIQTYIFKKMRETAESFGYSEYDASILESAELYRAKSGDEIVNEQTYTFTDRGDREVTLRPEMTPTVARMVAARERELPFPLRWYSIPNLFRYEKPQRGRLREHWQLNVDIFGIASINADVEVITLAHAIMKNMGATDADFIVRINSRKIINQIYTKNGLTEDQAYKTSKLIDKKDKMSRDAFTETLTEIVGDASTEILHMLESNEHLLDTLGRENSDAIEIVSVIEKLASLGVTNVVFDPTLMRGFDYYTGIVFEIFDTHPDNNRSLFGGGRYDDLLDIFGSRKIPAFGFGMGDVGAQNFLQVHNLLPPYTSSTHLSICPMSPEYISNANALAQALRKEGVSVAVDYTEKKIGDQIKTADKQHIPYIIVIGENEVKSDTYTLKHLATGTEIKVSIADIKKNISNL
jgi:histidyl-tRNA synthetase